MENLFAHRPEHSLGLMITGAISVLKCFLVKRVRVQGDEREADAGAARPQPGGNPLALHRGERHLQRPAHTQVQAATLSLDLAFYVECPLPIYLTYTVFPHVCR